MKIRDFGFLSHRIKKQALRLIRKLIGPGGKINRTVKERELNKLLQISR